MNPVVHFEMPYESRERIARFYESAFGWQTQLLGEEMDNYVPVTTAVSDANSGMPAGAINGGFFLSCPVNRVPDDVKRIFFKNYQIFSDAWGRKEKEQ